MKSENFILINLNQNISRARKIARKEEKDKWIIFGLLCFIFVGLISWFIVINQSFNQLVQARENIIADIKLKTSNLKKDAKINLSKGDIISSYELGEKHIPWARKLIQLSGMTPYNMCITKLIYDYNSLTISAISKIENTDRKEQQILNDFMNSIQNNEDFYKEFDEIKIKKTKKMQAQGTDFLSFEIAAKIKIKLENRLDNIVVHKTDVVSNEIKKKKKKKKKEKKAKYSNEIIKLAESIDVSDPDTILVKEFQSKLNIYSKENDMFGVFDSKTILVYGDVLNIKPETSWEKEKRRIDKILAGVDDKVEVPSKSNEYDKLTIKIANKIASGNLNHPDPELIKRFQELVGIATENDSWYGEFNPETIKVFSEVLGIES